MLATTIYLGLLCVTSFNVSGTNSMRWLLPLQMITSRLRVAVTCQWQSQDSNLVTWLQSPGSIMSLLLMELLSSLTPPPSAVLETSDGGGVRGGHAACLPRGMFW